MSFNVAGEGEDHHHHTGSSGFGSSVNDRLSLNRAHTMKDFEMQITDLKKENFKLKLRIYFLEEKVQQKCDSGSEDLYRANIELKVEVESLKHDLQEKQNLLVKASKAVESLAGDSGSKIQRLKEESLKQLKDVEDSLNQKIQLLEKEVSVANEEVLKIAALLDQERLQRINANEKLSEMKHNNAMLEERDGVIEQLNQTVKSKEALILQLEQKLSSTKPRGCSADIALQGNDHLMKKDSEDDRLQASHGKPEVDGHLDNNSDEAANATKVSWEMQQQLKEMDNVLNDCQQKLQEKEAEIALQKKNAFKRDKTIQGLTVALKHKDKENNELLNEIESLNVSLAKARELVHEAQVQNFKGVEDYQGILIEKEQLLTKQHASMMGKEKENRKLLALLQKKDTELDDLYEQQEQLRELDAAQQEKICNHKTINDLNNQLEKLNQEMLEKESTLQLHCELIINEHRQQLQDQELVIIQLRDKLHQTSREYQETKVKLEKSEHPVCDHEELKKELDIKEECIHKLNLAIQERDQEAKQLADQSKTIQQSKELLEKVTAQQIKEKDFIISELQELLKKKEPEGEKEPEYRQLIRTLKAEQEMYSQLIQSARGAESLQNELDAITLLRKRLEADIQEIQELRRVLKDQIMAARWRESDTVSFLGDHTSYFSICLDNLDQHSEHLSVEELHGKVTELMLLIKEMQTNSAVKKDPEHSGNFLTKETQTDTSSEIALLKTSEDGKQTEDAQQRSLLIDFHQSPCTEHLSVNQREIETETEDFSVDINDLDVETFQHIVTKLRKELKDLKQKSVLHPPGPCSECNSNVSKLKTPELHDEATGDREHVQHGIRTERDSETEQITLHSKKNLLRHGHGDVRSSFQLQSTKKSHIPVPLKQASRPKLGTETTGVTSEVQDCTTLQTELWMCQLQNHQLSEQLQASEIQIERLRASATQIKEMDTLCILDNSYKDPQDDVALLYDENNMTRDLRTKQSAATPETLYTAQENARLQEELQICQQQNHQLSEQLQSAEIEVEKLKANDILHRERKDSADLIFNEDNTNPDLRIKHSAATPETLYTAQENDRLQEELQICQQQTHQLSEQLQSAEIEVEKLKANEILHREMDTVHCLDTTPKHMHDDPGLFDEDNTDPDLRIKHSAATPETLYTAQENARLQEELQICQQQNHQLSEQLQSAEIEVEKLKAIEILHRERKDSADLIFNEDNTNPDLRIKHSAATPETLYTAQENARLQEELQICQQQTHQLSEQLQSAEIEVEKLKANEILHREMDTVHCLDTTPKHMHDDPGLFDEDNTDPDLRIKHSAATPETLYTAQENARLQEELQICQQQNHQLSEQLQSAEIEVEKLKAIEILHRDVSTLMYLDNSHKETDPAEQSFDANKTITNLSCLNEEHGGKLEVQRATARDMDNPDDDDDDEDNLEEQRGRIDNIRYIEPFSIQQTYGSQSVSGHRGEQQVSGIGSPCADPSLSRYKLLVQSQARELSGQRQQIKESHSLNVLCCRSFINAIKVFDELLQASDVDFYVAEGFREQLNQSIEWIKKLEYRLSHGERATDADTNEDEMIHRYNADTPSGEQLKQYRDGLSSHHMHSEVEISEIIYVGSSYHNQEIGKSNPQELSQNLLIEHLEEIRKLRQRLEVSIKTNDMLRKQLERQITEAEQGGTYGVHKEAHSELVSEIYHLRKQNEAFKYLIAKESRDKETEELRETVSQKSIAVEHLTKDCERMKKDHEKMQQILIDKERKIGRLSQELASNCKQLARQQSELSLQHQQMAEQDQLIQSLRVELKVYEHFHGRDCRTSAVKASQQAAHDVDDANSDHSADSFSYMPSRLVPGHRVWADKHGRHVLGLVEDIGALRKQISEGGGALQELEAYFGHDGQTLGFELPEDLEIMFSDRISRSRQCLEEAGRLTKLLWRVSLPGNVRSSPCIIQDEEMRMEILRLRKKLSVQEKKFSGTVKRLHTENQKKDDIERVILNKLTLTHKVLKKARGNLEMQPMEIHH